MDFPIKGGVGVVTGAASGIGAALAVNLAGRGMHLALADRNAEGLAAVAGAARAQGVTVSEHVLDVRDARRWRRCRRRCWRRMGGCRCWSIMPGWR
jgi:NADP-dependent 3-hydroxy acid dehydrogenase YdfG